MDNKLTKSQSIFVFDIGNTRVTYAEFKMDEMKEQNSLPHDTIPDFILNRFEKDKNTQDLFVFCSVIPNLTQEIIDSLPNHIRKNCKVVGKDLPIDFQHQYKQWDKLGMDRKINVFGAINQGLSPALIIDFGTAVTFDYINERGIFEGGYIIPGPELSFQALREKAALLPKNVRLPESAKREPGKTTEDCMTSGILEGYGAMTDELIRRFRSRSKQPLHVILTGGFAKTLKPFTIEESILAPQHTLNSIHNLVKSVSF